MCGLIVERITNKPYWAALQDLIWDRIGAEADGFHYISDAGVAAVHGGLWARLRDIARFGQVFTASAGLGEDLAAHTADLRSDNGVRLSEEQIQSFINRSPALAEDTPTHTAWQWGSNLGGWRLVQRGAIPARDFT